MKIRSNILLILSSYIIMVTILLVYTIGTYEYRNYNLIIFACSFYVFGTLIALDYSRKQSLFSFGVVFNIFALLYSNFYIFEQISLGFVISNYVYMSMELSYISILSFNIAYFFAKVDYKKEPLKDKHFYTNGYYNTTKMLSLLSLLLIISILAELYVVFYNIGLVEFFHATRAEKALLIADYSMLTFYQSTIPIIAAISLLINLEYNSIYSQSLFGVSLILSIFNAVIRGSRAEIICILLPIIFLLKFYGKISNKAVIMLSIATILLFGVWKSLYNASAETTIYFDSEFNSWYRICDHVLSYDIELLVGSSYLKTIENLLIPISNSTSLSTWYLQNYEPDVLLRGGGRGFSGVLEAYLNFGIVGNIIVFFFYGTVMKKIESITDNQRGVRYSLVVTFIMLSSIYLFFRAESYSLWKNMAWFKIYPTAIIFLLSRNNNYKYKF